MIANLSRAWWLVALRGVIGIVFGIVALVWPGITLLSLVLVVGAYLFIDGVFALAQAVRFRHERERWPMLLVEGVLGIAVGVVSFLAPGITALAWLYTLAAWAIITGVLEIVAAIRLRKIIQGEWLLGLTGVASIILGIALAALPAAGLIAWVWVIGIYSIVFGAALLALAFRLRSIAESTISPTGIPHAGAT